jgi:hypothetical protein
MLGSLMFNATAIWSLANFAEAELVLTPKAATGGHWELDMTLGLIERRYLVVST